MIRYKLYIIIQLIWIYFHNVEELTLTGTNAANNNYISEIILNLVRRRKRMYTK